MKHTPIIFFILLFCLSVAVKSQTVLLNIDRENEPAYNKGPNTINYAHALFDFGFVLPPDYPGSRVTFGNSVCFSFGLRSKYKISRFYSMGWEFHTGFCDYNLKQQTGKTFPDTQLVDVQRFDVANFTLGYFNRFNFDVSRGNIIGHFLDIGIRGKYNYSMEEVNKQKVVHGNATTKIDHLKYANKLHAELFARIGSGRYSLWIAKRLSKMFKPEFGYSELPNTTIGIEIALF